jgi:hypothetical protein
VVAVDIDLQLGALDQVRTRRHLGQLAAQLTQLQGAADDLAVALRGVDLPLMAVVELRVEEGRRLPRSVLRCGRVVGDRGRDPTEQEAGLVGAELEVGALAVGVGGGRLAEHASQASPLGPVHQEALGAGEEVLSTRRRQRHRLAGMGDGVSGRRQTHPLMAKQLPGDGLGDARDVAAVGQPGGHLGCVVDPPNVVGLPVGRFDCPGQHATLVRPQEPEVHVHQDIFATTPA